MASIINRPNGHRWIGFKGPTGKRHTIRLGRTSKRQAADFKRRIESLLASVGMAQSPDLDTARWIGALSPELHARVAATGLFEPRVAVTMGDLFEHFLASLSVKPATRRNLGILCGNLQEFFEADRSIGAVTDTDAQRFRSWLATNGGRNGGPLATATVSRRLRRARQVFAHAVDQGWITRNPFAKLAGRNEVNRAKDFYVTAEIMAQILEVSPDAELRAIVALARYGGLRCPSEVVPLEWDAVNWERQTLRVTSPKTEHHEGQAIRTVPLFPQVHDALTELWDQTPEGQALLFPNHQMTGAGLIGRLEAACRRAGIPPWPRPWKNMRATCETELLEQHPIQVVASWLGHSPTVALQHYAQIAKEHHARAVARSQNEKSTPTRPPGGAAKPEARTVH